MFADTSLSGLVTASDSCSTVTPLTSFHYSTQLLHDRLNTLRRVGSVAAVSEGG